MNILHLLFILVVIAVALWAVNAFLGQYMAPSILKIINIAVPVVVILWIVSLYVPVFSYLDIPVGRGK